MVKNKQNEVVSEEPLGDIHLSQDLFVTCIDQVKEHFQKLGKNMELAILGQPMRVEGNKILLDVMGSVQEEIANKMKIELIRVIRELTGVNHFYIELVLKEDQDHATKILYTDSDKFERLKELHPALIEFQRVFGLETDY